MHCRLTMQQDIYCLYQQFQQTVDLKKPMSLFEQYMDEQSTQKILFFIAILHDTPCGYVTLRWQSSYHYFKDNTIPEIMDLNVLPSYRRQDIAQLLLTHVEEAAQQKSNKVGIGVGLYDGYGAAQRLYIKRGYIPDGKGVTYNYQKPIWETSYPIDDNLVLWLIKTIQ